MENERKIVLGYDLNNELSQVSFCDSDTGVPTTLSTVTGTEKYVIPTVIGKKKGINQWFFGEEAIQLANKEDGILVQNILELARNGGSFCIEEIDYSAVSLLALFLKRTLALVNLVIPWQSVDFITITVENLDKEMIELLQSVIRELPIEPEKIKYQNYSESFYYYMLHQPKELWKYQVIILDNTSPYLKSYRLEINNKTNPKVVLIDKAEYKELTYSDQELLTISKDLVEGRIVSSVYLIGDGFEEDRIPETLKYLCSKRRVFSGKNLYTKGAAFSAFEQINPSTFSEEFAFLGNNKLKCNIGMKVIRSGVESYVALADAGINWYDVACEREFLLGKEKEIRILLTPLIDKNVRWVVIRLNEIPERKSRASRVRVKLNMKSETILSVKIKDLGFGEIFPSTDQIWEEEIQIYDP
ncbi:MAG: DUF5716 family protein [Lachnospiraceae bacterium]|nr:DUF5716 family protein [Lachnospiraceae bacterium]